MNLTQSEKEMLQKACDNLNYSIHEDYSGRGMFGETCFGFVTSDVAGPIKVIHECWKQVSSNQQTIDFDDIMRAFQGMRTDDFGKGTIYYFPKINW